MSRFHYFSCYPCKYGTFSYCHIYMYLMKVFVACDVGNVFYKFLLYGKMAWW